MNSFGLNNCWNNTGLEPLEFLNIPILMKHFWLTRLEHTEYTHGPAGLLASPKLDLHTTFLVNWIPIWNFTYKNWTIWHGTLCLSVIVINEIRFLLRAWLAKSASVSFKRNLLYSLPLFWCVHIWPYFYDITTMTCMRMLRMANVLNFYLFFLAFAYIICVR